DAGEVDDDRAGGTQGAGEVQPVPQGRAVRGVDRALDRHRRHRGLEAVLECEAMGHDADAPQPWPTARGPSVVTAAGLWSLPERAQAAEDSTVTDRSRKGVRRWKPPGIFANWDSGRARRRACTASCTGT